MFRVRGGVWSGTAVLTAVAAVLLGGLVVLGLRAATIPDPPQAPVRMRPASGEIAVPVATPTRTPASSEHPPTPAVVRTPPSPAALTAGAAPAPRATASTPSRVATSSAPTSPSPSTGTASPSASSTATPSESASPSPTHGNGNGHGKDGAPGHTR